MYLFPDIKIDFKYLQNNLLCFTSTLTELLPLHISFKCKWLAKLGLSRLKNYEPFPDGLFPEEHV